MEVEAQLPGSNLEKSAMCAFQHSQTQVCQRFTWVNAAIPTGFTNDVDTERFSPKANMLRLQLERDR